jgi:Tol biopolymer transport system component
VKRWPALCAAALLIGCGAAPSPTAVPPARDAGQQALTAVAAIDQRQGPSPTPPRPSAPLVVLTPGVPTPVGGAAAGTLGAAKFDGQIVVARDDAVAILEGGQQKVLFKAEDGGSVKDPAFSPDGKSVAFAYAPPRPKVQPGRPIVEQLLFSDIMLVGADGSNPRPVVKHDVPGSILELPSWSPDGKAILYSYYAPTYKGNDLVDEVLEVRRRDVDGNANASTVVKSASNSEISRDGKWLAYIKEDQNEGQSLHVMAAGGGSDRQLVGADRFAALLAPRFSPDGNSIAFSAADAGPVTAPGQPPLPPPKALGPLDSLRALIAPSAAEAHGLPWEIWTVPIGGGTPKQLTQLQEDTPYAAWSSNGARLLVFGAGGLHVVEAASGKTQTLTSDGAHGGMDWRSAS